MAARLRLAGGIAVAGLYAILALGSGLDRMSEDRPSLARHVPEFFQTFAARQLASDALQAQRPRDAIRPAMLAVQHDPADARSTGALGAAYYGANQSVRARETFSISGALGWREPLTQLYWMSAALEQGDLRVASPRLDAILRQTPQFEGRRQLLAPLEASPEGRAQLVRRLADTPWWRDDYFRDGYTLPLSGQSLRASVALGLVQDAGIRDCALVAPLTLSLASGGNNAGAHEVWRAHCMPPGEAGLIADGSFERASLTKRLTAFDWTWPEDGAIETALGPVPGFAGNALTVASTAPGKRAVATQLLALAPGRYRVTWRAASGPKQPATGISLSVTCERNERHQLAARLLDSRAARFAAEFDVPGTCPAQWLALIIAQGSEAATIDDVAIARR
jgi:hypothetical protein